MKCVLISLCEYIAEPSNEKGESDYKYLNFTMFNSKKDILKYLIKYIRYDDGKKPKCKNLNEFLKTFKHCMSLINIKDIDYTVRKFRKKRIILKFENFKYNK